MMGSVPDVETYLAYDLRVDALGSSPASPDLSLETKITAG
jgi:hypothetical protein